MQIEEDTNPILPPPLDTKHNEPGADNFYVRTILTYALRKYFQDVPTKYGSLLMVSIAQNPIGIRTQFRPAAEMNVM